VNKGNCFQVVADSFSPGSVDGKSGKMGKNGKIGENGEKGETRGNWGKIGEIERTFAEDNSVLKVTKSHTVKVCLIGLFIILKLGIFVFSYYILQG
jgi:hypothetical protein